MVNKEEEINNAVYPKDLIFNREGVLSDTQRTNLYLFVIFWFGVAIINLAFLIFLGYFQFRYQSGQVGYLLLCFISAISIRYCILNALPFQKDIKNNQVKTIVGNVSKRLFFTGSGKSSIAHCLVSIGDEAFNVTPTYMIGWKIISAIDFILRPIHEK